MTTPECRQGHGPMQLRPTTQQTPEQLWCGTWWDCTHIHCRSAYLYPSPELRRQHRLPATEVAVLEVKTQGAER